MEILLLSSSGYLLLQTRRRVSHRNWGLCVWIVKTKCSISNKVPHVRRMVSQASCFPFSRWLTFHGDKQVVNPERGSSAAINSNFNWKADSLSIRLRFISSRSLHFSSINVQSSATNTPASLSKTTNCFMLIWVIIFDKILSKVNCRPVLKWFPDFCVNDVNLLKNVNLRYKVAPKKRSNYT